MDPIHLFVAIAYLLGIHTFADFVCQTDWMAKNKSKNPKALFAHGAMYTAVLVLLGGFPSGPNLFTLLLVLNGIVHTGVDAITSRLSAKAFAAGNTHRGFIIIGWDQFIHTVLLIGTVFVSI